MDNRDIDAARLAFMGLEADEGEALSAIRKSVEGSIDHALDRFYDKLAEAPAAASLFTDPSTRMRARQRQHDHWMSLASGHLDAEYFVRSRKIGQVHARIGLEPRWYMGGYSVILEALLEGVLGGMAQEGGPFYKSTRHLRAKQGKALGRLIKAIILDMEIAVSTYFEQISAEAALLNRELEQVIVPAGRGDLSHRIEARFTNADLNGLADHVNSLLSVFGDRLNASGSVLSALAKADLSQRVEGKAEGAFAQLRDDTNAVAETMSSIVDRLRQASLMLKRTTGEMVNSADDLSDRTNRQAAAIEQIAAAMSEIVSTVSRNTVLAETTESSVRRVSAELEETTRVIRNATGAMGDIRSASNQIAAIIGLIDNIAFQTNLLALNASVEAARAGEAGKGFAVVAVEVRRLAQSAAASSSDIKTLVEGTLSTVEKGSSLVEAAAGHVEGVSAAVLGTKNHAASMVATNSELLATLSEINRAVQQIDEMTQHNAGLIEETNAAIAQTEAQASALDRIVEVFRFRPVSKPANDSADPDVVWA